MARVSERHAAMGAELTVDMDRSCRSRVTRMDAKDEDALTMALPAGDGQLGKTRTPKSVSELGFLKPPVEDCVADDVDAATQPQLSHGVGFVHLDRFDRDAERVGDLLVAVADGHHAEDVLFALAHRDRSPASGDITGRGRVAGAQPRVEV